MNLLCLHNDLLLFHMKLIILMDWNETQDQHHFVCTQTLKSAECLSSFLSTYQ